MDHKVTGGWPASRVAAAGGAARRPWLREGEREREGAHPGQELTPETMTRTERHGEDRSGGEELGGAAAVVGEGADGGDDFGHPGPIQPAGRCSTARRC